jgi:hypothetical protein
MQSFARRPNNSKQLSVTSSFPHTHVNSVATSTYLCILPSNSPLLSPGPNFSHPFQQWRPFGMQSFSIQTPPPILSGFVATPHYAVHTSSHSVSRVVVGSMPVTGWDNLALQAATTVWRGEGTCMALVVFLGLISSCCRHVPPHTFSPLVVMCNIGSVPLAQ